MNGLRATPLRAARRAFRRCLRLLLVLWLTAWAGLAAAHEMTMAEMELRETVRGEFLWQWTASNRAASQDLTPRWPAGCQADAALLRCGPQGLTGRLRVDGVGDKYSAVMVKVFWAEGGGRVYTLTPAQPEVQLWGAADDRRGWGEIASAYTVLGVEHILGGVDHLLFVVGLLFLVGFQRRLVATITAFTLAHSLTLASSALGWLALRPPPVEAAIALSIVLVAAEALHTRDTLARRWPAAVAFLFGLVHGLGFAGALQQVGLPQQHLLVALLTFNLGVELGQLGVIAAAYALWRLGALGPGGSRVAFGGLRALRMPALYGIGSVAACWTIQRVAGVLA